MKASKLVESEWNVTELKKIKYCFQCTDNVILSIVFMMQLIYTAFKSASMLYILPFPAQRNIYNKFCNL